MWFNLEFVFANWKYKILSHSWLVAIVTVIIVVSFPLSAISSLSVHDMDNIFSKQTHVSNYARRMTTILPKRPFVDFLIRKKKKIYLNRQQIKIKKICDELVSARFVWFGYYAHFWSPYRINLIRSIYRSLSYIVWFACEKCEFFAPNLIFASFVILPRPYHCRPNRIQWNWQRFRFIQMFTTFVVVTHLHRRVCCRQSIELIDDSLLLLLLSAIRIWSNTQFKLIRREETKKKRNNNNNMHELVYSLMIRICCCCCCRCHSFSSLV